MGSGTMAFFHGDDVPTAWGLAAAFAGEGGRIATLPDIVDARIMDPTGRGKAWTAYHTTLTSEFYGTSPGGVPVVAVLHGTGPLSTREGFSEAYAWHERNGDRRMRGGRVSLATFHEILDGRHGAVEAVALADVIGRHEHPLSASLTPEESRADPLLRARLGGQARLDAYVAVHEAIAVAERADMYAQHARFGRVDAYGPAGRILRNRDSNQCGYVAGDFSGPRFVPRPAEVRGDGTAYAHLLSIAQVVHCGDGGSRIASVESEIGIHDPFDGVRLVGIRAGSPPGPIRQAGDYFERAVSRGLPEVWVDADGADARNEAGMFTLMRVGDAFYAQYPADGVSLDTAEPMLATLSCEPLGGPVKFEVETAGHHSFFRYRKSDVARHAPDGANAYMLVGSGSFSPDGKRQAHHARFYRVEVDRTRRLLRRAEVEAAPALASRLAEAA